jgi:hypothetical protein
MNSMPMPSPRSLVRTKERVVTCSDSIDKSTLRLVPMERGKRKDSLDVTAAAANVGGGTEPTVQPH